MKVQDLLKQYAVESGEIPASEIITPEIHDDLDGDGDAAELLVVNSENLDKANNLVESLESLAKHYGEREITTESLENYRLAIGHVLNASGIQIPLSVTVPSFEDASEDKTSIGKKIGGVVTAIIKWIKDQIVKLKNLFGRIVQRGKNIRAKVVAAKPAVQVNITELKAKGIKHLVGKGKAGDDKTKLEVHLPSIPASLIEGGKFSVSKSEHYLTAAKAALEILKLTYKLRSSEESKVGHEKWKAASGGEKTSDYEVGVEELETFMHALDAIGAETSELNIGSVANFARAMAEVERAAEEKAKLSGDASKVHSEFNSKTQPFAAYAAFLEDVNRTVNHLWMSMRYLTVH